LHRESSVKKTFALLVCASIVCACTSVHSNITVNGAAFGPDSCRNLEDEALFGVDLKDESGTTLRLSHKDDDSIDVIVIDGIHKPVAMNGCSHVSFDRGDNDKYGDYQMSGNATIDCDDDADNIHVHGVTDFNDCDHDF
jgi:hypothetical protein